MNLKKIFDSKRICDGLDIDDINFVVSFNPNHQNNVNTNDLYNPKPFYSTMNGCKVVSVFERKMSSDGSDGNPLIYALKNYDKTEEELKKTKSSTSKWRFANPEYDILALLRRFVAVTKEFNEPFDTIIYIPSSSKLNKYLATCIKRIKGGDLIKGFFMKHKASYVQDYLLDEDSLLENFSERERNEIKEKIRIAFHDMRKNNNDKFSYKFFEDSRICKYMPVSMEVPNDVAISNEITGKINNKRILIVDDTITTQKTLSDSSIALLETFTPKEIIFFTLFTELH